MKHQLSCLHKTAYELTLLHQAGWITVYILLYTNYKGDIIFKNSRNKTVITFWCWANVYNKDKCGLFYLVYINQSFFTSFLLFQCELMTGTIEYEQVSLSTLESICFNDWNGWVWRSATLHPGAIHFDLGPGNPPRMEQTLPAFKGPQKMHVWERETMGGIIQTH